MRLVQIAQSIEETPVWRASALVIDVIRFSGTVCALARAGRRIVRIYETPQALSRGIVRFPEADIFSELDLGPALPTLGTPPGEALARFDNSPHAALDPSRAVRPALVVTGSGARAIAACAKASRILIGGFCNFTEALSCLRKLDDDLLIVPAALAHVPVPVGGQRIEDEACSEAFREALAGRAQPEKYLASLWVSERPAQFRSYRPADQDRDLSLCLSLDLLPVVPRIHLEDGVGIVC